MARKKVKLAFIEKDATRKAKYKKRKNDLLKKAGKLSTLCDIAACVIIYNSYDTQPEVWPSVQAAQTVMSKFKRMPEMEQSRKMMDQESFTSQVIVKAVDQTKKMRENNKEKEKEMTEVMYRCLTGQGVQNLGLGDVNHLGMLLDEKINEIGKRIEKLAKGEGSSRMVEVESSNEVAHMEVEKPSVDFGLEAMQRPEGFSELVNEHMGLVSAFEMMRPFGDNNNES